jgi:hypothetical protein
MLCHGLTDSYVPDTGAAVSKVPVHQPARQAVKIFCARHSPDGKFNVIDPRRVRAFGCCVVLDIRPGKRVPSGRDRIRELLPVPAPLDQGPSLSVYRGLIGQLNHSTDLVIPSQAAIQSLLRLRWTRAFAGRTRCRTSHSHSGTMRKGCARKSPAADTGRACRAHRPDYSYA